GIQQPQAALEVSKQALTLYRSLGDMNGEAGTLTNIGAIHGSNGEMNKALEFFEQALPLHRETGNREFEANTLTGIGITYSEMGQLGIAVEVYQQAIGCLETLRRSL